MKITIFTSKNSYLNKFINIIKEFFKDFDLTIVNCKEDIPVGDVAFYLSCYEIIKKDILSLNKYNIVIHESNLPQGKGWSPASWQILEGKNKIPLTLFEINEKIDAGNIYFKDYIELDGTELKDEWQTKIVNKKLEMCLRFLKEFINIKPYQQKGKESFYLKRTPADCELDINKTIKEQFNLLRIVDNENYPAFFEINGVKYKICINKIIEK